MEIESNQSKVEPVTISDILELASWDRPRTDEELHDFLISREQAAGL